MFTFLVLNPSFERPTTNVVVGKQMRAIVRAESNAISS